MSIWTHITGSFYVYSWWDGIGERLEKFMKSNSQRLTKGSKVGLEWQVKQSSRHTCSTYEDGTTIYEYGAGQLHIFGDMSNMTLGSFEPGLLDFIKVLRSAYPVRIGQVIVEDELGVRRLYWFTSVDDEIHVVDQSDVG